MGNAAEKHWYTAVEVGDDWKRLFVSPGGEPRWQRGQRNSGTLNLAERREAMKWAASKDYISRIRFVEVNPYPWVAGDIQGLHPDLLAKLNHVGRILRRVVYVRSGLRTYNEQLALWNAYKAGYGNLAAYPGTSNHEDRDGDGYGEAADCALGGPKGPNIGNVAKARSVMRGLGLCLPVKGETWHVEINNGQGWRA